MIFNAIMAVVFALVASVYLSRFYMAIRDQAAPWRDGAHARAERPSRYWSYVTIFVVIGLVSALCAIALGHAAFVGWSEQR